MKCIPSKCDYFVSVAVYFDIRRIKLIVNLRSGATLTRNFAHWDSLTRKFAHGDSLARNLVLEASVNRKFLLWDFLTRNFAHEDS
jgi:hypothetical protein